MTQPGSLQVPAMATGDCASSNTMQFLSLAPTPRSLQPTPSHPSHMRGQFTASPLRASASRNRFRRSFGSDFSSTSSSFKEDIGLPPHLLHDPVVCSPALAAWLDHPTAIATPSEHWSEEEDSQEASREATSGALEFCWSIDQMAHFYPAEIDEAALTNIDPDRHVAAWSPRRRRQWQRQNERVQHQIDKFFDPANRIAPSPAALEPNAASPSCPRPARGLRSAPRPALAMRQCVPDSPMFSMASALAELDIASAPSVQGSSPWSAFRLPEREHLASPGCDSDVEASFGEGRWPDDTALEADDAEATQTLGSSGCGTDLSNTLSSAQMAPMTSADHVLRRRLFARPDAALKWPEAQEGLLQLPVGPALHSLSPIRPNTHSTFAFAETGGPLRSCSRPDEVYRHGGDSDLSLSPIGPTIL